MKSHTGPELGIPEMDAQHADLFGHAGDLAAAARGRRAPMAVAAFDRLMEAVALHFAYEDELMDRTGYPDRVAHRMAHDLFLQDLAGAGTELRAAGVTPRVLEWATRRMPQWIHFHIEKNDRPLVMHLQRTRRRQAPAPQPHRS